MFSAVKVVIPEDVELLLPVEEVVDVLEDEEVATVAPISIWPAGVSATVSSAATVSSPAGVDEPPLSFLQLEKATEKIDKK